MTPNAKSKSAFKSPAPSNKKANQPPKSPLLMGSYAMQGICSSSEKWTVSPVCSRLREHILMLNNNSYKERIFLQSPMTTHLQWPLSSPAVDPYKTLNLPSTAQNTSIGSNKQFSHCT